ncbi:hypothetical protein QA634_09570 [Methylobacterium sp. CB376]|uniref:hypothetical protein n=1 Tax=unclassified Methylobacterium TaxID=2615210 RepID=UPI0012371ED8|nr:MULTISPECIES: hypothetical protein [Methylobacterium]WFT82076.1 hypothetical protein QA634_09570 [Methylobacterium nodulans]
MAKTVVVTPGPNGGTRTDVTEFNNEIVNTQTQFEDFQYDTNILDGGVHNNHGNDHSVTQYDYTTYALLFTTEATGNIVSNANHYHQNTSVLYSDALGIITQQHSILNYGDSGSNINILVRTDGAIQHIHDNTHTDSPI